MELPLASTSTRGLPVLLQGFQQTELAGRELQGILVAAGVFVARVALLAFQGGIQANAGNDHIRLLGGPLRFGQAVAGLPQALHPILVKMAAFGIKHPGFTLAGFPDTLQEGDIAAGNTVVVAFQHRMAVRHGAHHGHGLELAEVQGQQPVVAQQHHGAAGYLQGQGSVLVRVHFQGVDLVIFAVIREQAQADTGGHHVYRGLPGSLPR